MVPLNILVVDDDPVIREFMKIQLNKEAPRFSISVMDSGKSCLEYIGKHPVDCILSDYQMPDMDGLELLEAVRARGYEIPFIFVTGQGSEEVAREAFKAGAYDYFTKEVGFAHFPRIKNSILQAVRHRKAQESKKRAEEALRESEERFRLMAENLECMIWIGSPDFQTMYYLSPAYEKIWGRTRESLYKDPMSFMEALHEEDRQGLLEAMGSYTGESKADMEYRIIRPDGAIRWIRDRVVPIKDEAGVTYRVAGIAEDITEMKEHEKRREDLYAMIRHDIKTPLTVISGNADAILKEKSGRLDEETVLMLTGIRNSARGIHRILEDAVAGQKAGHCDMPLKKERTDVRGLLLEVFLNMAEKCRDKGLLLHKEIEEGLPEAAVDKACVQRAVANLLQNSINYTPRGGRIVLKAGRSRLGDLDGLFISVTDTGPGISPDEKEQVFQKYYRSPKCISVEGSGLGLAIVKSVAEAHGGRVEVESEEGKGCTFRFLLPR